MNDSKKFFQDNIARINPQADPVTWNLNNGLLAMAGQMAWLEHTIGNLQRETAQLRQEVQRLQSR